MKEQFHPALFQTFVCTNNSLVEQREPKMNSRNKLLQLHTNFNRTATTQAKANLVEIVGYQLGLHSDIDPILKAQMTNRGRILKQAVESVVTGLQHQQQQKESAKSSATTTKTVPYYRHSNGSQLYKMRMDFICNP